MSERAAADVPAPSEWIDAGSLKSDDAEALADFEPIDTAARANDIALAFRPLPFFDGGVWLLRLIPQGGTEATAGYGLWSGHGLFPLDGTSTPIHEAIEREGLSLTDETVLDYAMWFCRHVHGDEGPFWPVRSREDLNLESAAAGETVATQLIRAPNVSRGPTGDGWSVSMTVQYGENLFSAQFAVELDGKIEMIDDDSLLSGLKIDPSRNRRPLEWTLERDSIHLAGQPSVAPRHPNQRAVQRAVGEALARLQLIEALRRGDAASLFNSQAADDEGLLRDFANFVVTSAALVVIESRTDYIERLVAQVLIPLITRSVPMKHATFVSHPEPTAQLPEIEDGDLVLMSLHESSKIARPQAVAFVLGSTDAAMLVGCRARLDLPPPLREIVDVTLRLTPPHPALFERLFCEVFACAWPEAVDLGHADWLTYLDAADLQRALRDQVFRRAAAAGGEDGWRAQDAIEAIRARVRERLARFLPDEKRRLAELVGLGEARQIVEDLVNDFADAVSGRIPWADVDRGMLLVGPPGTGKTLLARVIARESGVRFVNARIGDWMTGDSGLGAVILAMRQTFVDARQFAPCILFLDEIDSLGSREHFGGRNEAWDVALLTAVLAELQGFESTPGIFVIGATNHEEQVDPALRRAGRLDQVVHIEHPMVPDLARMLDQYLAPYRATGRVGADVDTGALGLVMAGASGAEVAQYVRDAARRARREGGRIEARHLLAAATRVPRRWVASAGNMPVELERTAYHEAGHAVAQLLGSHQLFQLAVVSVIERSDGALGFTGFVPEETPGWTAAHYAEYLQTVLAGRAAEELRYGPEHVSSGAGGSQEHCDLAAATRMASRMVCQASLGRDALGSWSDQPGSAGDVELIRALIERSYADCLQRLRAHWRAVDALARQLVVQRQMLGSDVVELVRAHGLNAPSAKVEATAGVAS